MGEWKANIHTLSATRVVPEMKTSALPKTGAETRTNLKPEEKETAMKTAAFEKKSILRPAIPRHMASPAREIVNRFTFLLSRYPKPGRPKSMPPTETAASQINRFRSLSSKA
ncbi:MAG TPA: hypothetical protein VNQ78_08805 [Paracoccus sp. (in: a-proteobacteria)]|uniref:hypothetical protein n=1 Tax=Paracoccus sp. TaxID=267 RepID=UPI002C334269|nr:hypothetical protein [Paracoccus sp. (in: a-proteobacteria)]HWL56759.1 hypothetical protein [Paracoccus sp. (in: a-proteobacteria)]